MGAAKSGDQEVRVGEVFVECDCREGDWVYTGPMPGAKMKIPVKLNILDKSEEV
jgi:hypothetical protein